MGEVDKFCGWSWWSLLINYGWIWGSLWVNLMKFMGEFDDVYEWFWRILVELDDI